MKKITKFYQLSSQKLITIQGGSGTISILDTDMESVVKPTKHASSKATEELFGAYH